MRSIVRVTTTMALAIAVIASQASPAAAQLQWQANGAPKSEVKPASYGKPIKQASAGHKLQAKAPVTPKSQHSLQRVGAAPVAKKQPVAGPLAATMPPGLRPGDNILLDQSVEPVCHNGNCGPMGCECGTGSYGPGMGGPGMGCELTLGEPCGCDSVGCAGECGGCCGCGDVCGCGDPCGCGDVCGCGDSCGCGDTCGGYSGLGGCANRGGVPLILFLPPIQDFTLFGGVQGFKNGLDSPGRDRGNFGFHEGFNLGGRMAWLPIKGLAYQVGYQAVHSQLSGDTTASDSSSHTQQFFTGGLFRRRKVGLQYGLVYDYLRDERQEGSEFEFGQVRGSVSVSNPCGHEVGFLFTASTRDNTQDISAINGFTRYTYEPANQYLLFYRMHGCEGGEFSFYGGAIDEGKGLIGASLDAPLNNRFSFNAGFSYLIPEGSESASGAEEEAWNLGMNLVWHYGKRARCGYCSPYRPMFGVADNGSMILDSSDVFFSN